MTIESVDTKLSRRAFLKVGPATLAAFLVACTNTQETEPEPELSPLIICPIKDFEIEEFPNAVLAVRLEKTPQGVNILSRIFEGNPALRANDEGSLYPTEINDQVFNNTGLSDVTITIKEHTFESNGREVTFPGQTTNLDDCLVNKKQIGELLNFIHTNPPDQL